MFPSRGKRKDHRNGVKREKYNVPDSLDLELKVSKVEALSKTLDDTNKAKSISDTQIKALLRDATRKRWMHSKVKLSFLEFSAIPDYDENTRRLWKWQCAICNNFFNRTEVEVDHKYTGGDRDFETMCDSPVYVRGVLDVGWEDLQILCSDKEKGCHPIKSHAEKFGMTFEEARIEKIAIRWEKQNKGVQVQRGLLEKLGVENALSLKAKEIRKAYVEYLKQQEKEE